MKKKGTGRINGPRAGNESQAIGRERGKRRGKEGQGARGPPFPFCAISKECLG